MCVESRNIIERSRPSLMNHCEAFFRIFLAGCKKLANFVRNLTKFCFLEFQVQKVESCDIEVSCSMRHAKYLFKCKISVCKNFTFWNIVNTKYYHHKTLSTQNIINTKHCHQKTLSTQNIFSTKHCQHKTLSTQNIVNTKHCQHKTLSTQNIANTEYCQHRTYCQHKTLSKQNIVNTKHCQHKTLTTQYTT